MQISNINNSNFKSSFKVNKAQIKLNKIEKDFYNELKNIGIFNTVEENEQIHKYSVNNLNKILKDYSQYQKRVRTRKKSKKNMVCLFKKLHLKKLTILA